MSMLSEMLLAPSGTDAAGPLVPSSEMMMTLADQLEEAIESSSQARLLSVSAELVELYRRIFASLPDKMADAARGATLADQAERALYMLGQISFAQLLASQTSHRRISDGFIEALQSKSYKKYFVALLSSDRSGVDLSGEVGESAETVSRKLKVLRELGVTDFRRDGVRVLNFLTPAARAAIMEFNICNDAASSGRSVNSSVKRLTSEAQPHMRHVMTFATPVETRRA